MEELIIKPYFTHLSDMYLECFPGAPTITKPGTGGELSMMTPFDVAVEHNPAPLHASTVVKYLIPWKKCIVQDLSKIIKF